jgi:DNA replication and repair protein RecF
MEATFSSRVVTFVGHNGMGKTNLLDAIYYLSIGKSYFSSSDKLCASLDQTFFRIEGQIDEETVVAKVQPTKEKVLEVQGSKIEKLSDYVGRYPIVVIAPSDVQSLLDESENRRTLINYTIAQYQRNYLSDLMSYNRLLKHRNAMLKNYLEKRQIDRQLLETIDQQMAPLSTNIFEGRKKFIGLIQPFFNDASQEINDKNETLTLQYESSLSQFKYEELVQKNIEKDLVLGRTSSGIHKDDLIFSINGKKLRDFGSQGQIKTFILALKLAQYHLLKDTTNKLPCLLLDDIFDKLDTNRISHLLLMIGKSNFGQIFITDANKSRINNLLDEFNISYESFWIENGKLTRL